MSLHDNLVNLLNSADDALAYANARADAADVQSAELQAHIQDLDELILDLRARIVELEAQLPDPEPEPEPEPEPQSTVFGSDVTGTSSGAQDTKINKWGEGIAVRQFFTGFDQIAQHDSRAGLVHASWKPSSVAAITPNAVTVATARLLPGDCVEVWHESDKKVKDGVYSFTEAVARKNRFYEVVKQVRPDLLVVNTLTAWAAEPGNDNTDGNIDNWAQVKADLLGLDCDGIHGYPYPSYTSEIDTAVNFLEDFPAYSGWCVPEFGTSRSSSNDPSGTARASWATNYAERFKNAGAHYVCLYEYESTTGNAFTTIAELAAWREYTQP